MKLILTPSRGASNFFRVLVVEGDTLKEIAKVNVVEVHSLEGVLVLETDGFSVFLNADDSVFGTLGDLGFS